MGKLRLWWLAAGGWTFVVAAGALAAGRHEALSTPALLVDLARDHGLHEQGSQTLADVQHIRTLLRAATRLDPGQADAYVWLQELATLSGDYEGAAGAVRQLIAADPTHQGAFARWLDIGLEGSQTIEGRVRWLEETLQHGPQRPELQAMIHVRLSRLALARLDLDTARQHLQSALALDPWHPDAVTLQLELLEAEAPVAVRLRAGLKFLQLNPFDVETAWQVGMLLDQYGYYADAALFYEHALDIRGRENAAGPIPGIYLLQLSRHAVARGQPAQAEEYARQAIAVDPGVAAEGGIYLHWLLTARGKRNEAARVREQLAERFAELREPSEWPVNESAQAAWFYCTIDSQPRRGLMLAAAAADRAPDDLFVRRVLGWAQAINLQREQAQATLLPVAGRDPYAAYQLAKLLKEGGDEQAAERVLMELTPMPTVGPARELINELGFVAATRRPTAHRHLEIAEVLGSFDRGVLGFHRDPGRFLDASIHLEDRSPAPGEPWWAEFTLTNRGSFPITLGPEWMVNPVFLLSFEVEGDRQRAYPNLFTVTVDRVVVLMPGASARVRRTLDLGPLRRLSRKTPQQAQRVSVSAVLDPLQGPNGQWQPSLGGQRLRPVYLNRLPADTSPEATNALFRALSGVSARARFRAIEQMGQLLSERQRADLKRLNYQPQPIPARRIRQALLAALTGESWELRVRALDAIQIAGLDARMLAAVKRCLGHSHWLVRLMAARLLGERQGRPAAGSLRALAEDDEDELVREMAASYLAEWGSRKPTTRPVPARATSQAVGAGGRER